MASVQVESEISVSSLSIADDHDHTLEDASNTNRGLLRLPYELWGEVFFYYLGIDMFTEAPRHGCYLEYPVLPVEYLEKADVLRSLCQVCVAYRRNFLPFLWHSLSACCAARPGPDVKPMMFYRHVAETLISKCEGLTRSPELAALVRCVQLALTRYQSTSVIPTLATTLARLPNVNTLHILHAQTHMATALKEGFEGITLPQIRTVIIPGYCHEILKFCPNVKTVWCTVEDKNKLIPTISSYCREVVELRGVDLEEDRMQSFVEAVPNLRVLEIQPLEVESFLKHCHNFKDFTTLILRDTYNLDQTTTEDATKKEHLRHWAALKQHCAKALRDLPPNKGIRKRYLRISRLPSIAGKGGPRPVIYTDVEI